MEIAEMSVCNIRLRESMLASLVLTWMSWTEKESKLRRLTGSNVP